MTPKEKAQEIYDKIHFALPSYHDEGQQEHKSAKECALIAVDEIYKLRMTHGQHLDYDIDKINYYSYWEQVKQEIEKL